MVVGDAQQDVIIAGLLRRLWRAPTDGYHFRPLQAMCDTWATEFEQRLPSAPATLDARVGPRRDRTAPPSAKLRQRDVLLATDLHAGNVVASQRAPWLLIDPKPYLGDPAYDVVQQHLLNCDRLAADPGGLADRMAGLLGLGSERVTQWLSARCVQESLDQPALGRVALALASA